MAENKRKSDLLKVFEKVEPDEMCVIENLIDETVYLEMRMAELKKLPFISVHPNNPAIQKTTAAAKQYKETSQSYMNAVRILLSVLNKIDENAQDELLKKLEEFAP